MAETTAVRDASAAPREHRQAMILAAKELQRIPNRVHALDPADWARVRHRQR